VQRLLEDLLDVLPREAVLSLVGDVQTPIAAPVVESAQALEPGGVFVARSGASVDGHDFIPQAVERGAAAVFGSQPLQDLGVPYVQVADPQAVLGPLAAAYYEFPSQQLVLIGVTGTNGKTTTTTMLHSILRHSTGGRAGFISTIAADLGGETADTGLHVTTPGAPDVQRYLAEMVRNGITHAVIEMTSHGLAQGRLNGIDLDVAVLTNLTHEHLDYHGSFENYRAAKGRMFEMLAQSKHKHSQNGTTLPKLSVINDEDTNAHYFAEFPSDRVIRYGISNQADYSATDVSEHDGSTTFQVVYRGQPLEGRFSMPLIGRFNVMNALAAVAVTHSLGARLAAIERGLLELPVIAGRMERIDEGQEFTAIVDFAHTPDALEKALITARGLTSQQGRVIAVFGSAGLRDVEKRRMMAEVSAQLANITVLTAEDPRTEPLDAILQMMADGCLAHGGIEDETFMRVPDRGEALYRACQLARPGDVVIACGKGHEQSMCFGTTEYPWDDREALRAALQGAPLRTLPTAVS
jgi:UDP-N-acetylmuramoyl-L-alanyl-D-glutamate--2,6-diaminopimelate ligase